MTGKSYGSATTSLWPGRAKALHVHGTEGFFIIEADVMVDWRTMSGGEAELTELLAQYGGPGTGRPAERPSHQVVGFR